MTEFIYYQKYVDAKETLSYYKQLELSERAAGKGYSAWMCTRRQGEYSWIVAAQTRNEHLVAVVLDGALVCTCGLIDSESRDDGNEAAQAEFLGGPGHVDRR
jgi:hypothetical protein